MHEVIEAKAYAPPFTVYALSASPGIEPRDAASRDTLLAAIQGHILAQATLTVTYSRQ